MTDLDLAFMTVRELAPLIESREVSPVDLVEAQLGRIAELDDVLRAYIHVGAEVALGQAKAAEAEIAAGGYRWPLHGLTVAHKDIIDVAGMPTTAASKVMPQRIARQDATVQARLRAAGAICLGKLNLIEFASGSMGVFGFARNPWNLSAYPGGSSSGSGTALSAGLVTIATGTDTGGSVRNPACFCGLAGMRATYGRVSRHGCIPLSWSQDSIGPMGRSVADLAYMLTAMAGPDRHDQTSQGHHVPYFAAELERGLKGLRIGVPSSFYLEDLDPEIDAAMRAALKQLEDLGAELRPVSLPASEYASAASWVIAYTESFVYHKSWFETSSKEYTPAFYHKIAAAGMTSAEERIVSQQVRQVVTREFVDAMREVDVIVTPTSRSLASADSRSVPPGERTLAWGAEMTSVTRPVSLTGFPAISVPIGFANDNTPRDELKTVFDNLGKLAAFCAVDFKIVRGLAYYTGIVWEIHDRKGELRAIAGGGRYDGLLKQVSGVDLPALGFGMGDVVLGELLKDRGLLPVPTWGLDCYLVIADEALRPAALGLIQGLREAGIAVDYALTAAKIGKQFEMASALGARFAVVVGPTEWPTGEVTLKNLSSKTQELVKVGELAKKYNSWRYRGPNPATHRHQG